MSSPAQVGHRFAIADAHAGHVGLVRVHLLQALIDQPNGTVKPLLRKAGFDINGLQADLQEAIEQLPSVNNPTGEVRMSQELGRLLNLADKKAQQQGDKFISSESVLLAALEDSGKLGQLLNKHGVPGNLQDVVDELRGGDTVDDQGPP